MITLEDGMLKGKSKYYKKVMMSNVVELNKRIMFAKSKGKKSVRFLRGTGYSGKLTDEQFTLLLQLIENNFKLDKEESFGGDGERFVYNVISW